MFLKRLISQKSGGYQRREQKGFTLAELLIVVAIIAVLVAIAIPIFTTQLEKSRDSVTVANLRSAYTEATDKVITENQTVTSGIQVVAKGRTGDLSGLNEDLPFTMTEETINLLGSGNNKICYITFDFSDTSRITASAGSAPYVGQMATSEELSNCPKFRMFSGGKLNLYTSDNYGSYYDADPEINTIYQMQDINRPDGAPRYYRYDGTNWYATQGVGSPWTVYNP